MYLTNLYFIWYCSCTQINNAYKADHTCGTALLRVYNDIVTAIGRGMVQCLFYLICLLLLTHLIIIICFAYSKNMSEFVVML